MVFVLNNFLDMVKIRLSSEANMTVTISLFDVLIFLGIIQAIFFVIGVVKDDFFYPSITCPVFWYVARLVYTIYILCKGSRYTYNYTNIYDDDMLKTVGYKKFKRWFTKEELKEVYKWRKEVEENRSDMILK